MEIKHKLEQNKGMFFVEVDGEQFAEMSYSKAGDSRIIIHHTDVAEKLRGKNIGKQLVTAAVEMARANHWKIFPLCPFARSVFERVPEFADVWDH